METALKQRLVGATVLVALAVIFLPMLVKGPAPESGVGDVSLELPETPQAGFETREIPLGTPAAGGAATGMPAPAGGQLPTVDAGAAPSADVRLPPATAAGDYAVGFGSYATDADAARVVAALTAAQLPAFHEPVAASDGRTLHRVRIGPYASRAEAEAARLRAGRISDKVVAKVVTLDAPDPNAKPAASAPMPAAPATATASVAQPLRTAPPATSAPVPLAEPKPASRPVATEPAKPATTTKPAEPVAPAPVAARPATANVGFAVQLGAFGNADEAAKLRDRARAAGFSAFVEQVRTDKGALNRVRIGPVADRAEADRLRAQVSASLGVAGLVRPHP